MKAWALILAALATPATAETPAWVGYWAENVAWCLNAGEVGDETPDLYDQTGIYGLEWSCEIDQITAIPGGTRWHVTMSCLDTGEEFKADSLWIITHRDRLLIIDEYGDSNDLLRCAKKPE
jgi:hypothetical protein